MAEDHGQTPAKADALTVRVPVRESGGVKVGTLHGPLMVQDATELPGPCASGAAGEPVNRLLRRAVTARGGAVQNQEALMDG